MIIVWKIENAFFNYRNRKMLLFPFFSNVSQYDRQPKIWFWVHSWRAGFENPAQEAVSLKRRKPLKILVHWSAGNIHSPVIGP